MLNERNARHSPDGISNCHRLLRRSIHFELQLGIILKHKLHQEFNKHNNNNIDNMEAHTDINMNQRGREIRKFNREEREETWLAKWQECNVSNGKGRIDVRGGRMSPWRRLRGRRGPSWLGLAHARTHAHPPATIDLFRRLADPPHTTTSFWVSDILIQPL